MDQTIIDTINNMRNSGISDDEIKNLLASMGYDDSLINEALSYGKTQKKVQEPTKPEESKEKTEIKEEIKEIPVEKTQPNVNDSVAHAELASNLAMNVSEHAVKKVEEHKEEVKAIKENVESLKTEINNIPKIDHIQKIQTKTEALHLKTSELETKIDDILARVKVLENIMKKILDNQRDILLKLE